jgi:hypothetical protein
LALIRLAINTEVETLSKARSISRNAVTLALLLKPCVMCSTFRSNARVVQCPLLNSYWSSLIIFGCRSWSVFTILVSQQVFVMNSVGLLVCNPVGTNVLCLVSVA